MAAKTKQKQCHTSQKMHSEQRKCEHDEAFPADGHHVMTWKIPQLVLTADWLAAT